MTPKPLADERRVRRFGYIPDLPDANDYLMARRPLATIPTKVSLRADGLLGTPYDQGDLGSCTANAIAKAFRYALVTQTKPVFDPSRLFVYYGEREIEHTIGSDAGAMIRDGMKVISKLGVPPESVWPYDIRRFDAKPSPSAYTEGARHQCITYRRVAAEPRRLADALARGFPVVGGFTVYDSFYRVDPDGNVPTPKKGETVEGGHAVLLTGYEQLTATRFRFEWLNSWGAEWGSGGYFYTASNFLAASHAADFWTIEVTE
jgi:C1A family cysteine protease